MKKEKTMAESLITKLIGISYCVPMDETLLPEDEEQVWGLPMCFSGDPGTAKTKIIRSVNKRLGLFTHTMTPSTLSPERIGGYPTRGEDGWIEHLPSGRDMKDLIELGEGVIFVDEINTARSQAAILRLILERVFGEYQLPKKIRTIAAMNPSESSTEGIELSPAAANRFWHGNFPVANGREWFDHVSGHQEDEKDKDKKIVTNLHEMEKKVIEHWKKVFPVTVGLFGGFAAKKGQIQNMPEIGSPNRSKAWPSIRSYTNALMAATTCRILGAGDAVEAAFIEGCIGNGLTQELLTFKRHADLPDPADLLRQGTWTPDKRRLDIAHMVYETLGMYVAMESDKNKQPEMAAAAWKILEEGCAAGLSDLVTRPAKALVRAGFGASREGETKDDKQIRTSSSTVLGRMYPVNQQVQAAT